VDFVLVVVVDFVQVVIGILEEIRFTGNVVVLLPWPGTVLHFTSISTVPIVEGRTISTGVKYLYPLFV